MASAAIPPPPLFDPARHLKYWRRCLRTLLPHEYTSNDSTRMALGFFVVAAVDLLTPSSAVAPAAPPEQLLTLADRRRFRDWVLSCQHPEGGFWGSPTHAVPRPRAETQDFTAGEQEESQGSANIASTSFALLLLALLAEEDEAEGAYTGVDRVKTLRWLRRLQREEGSFGEVLVKFPGPGAGGDRWVPAGGQDMRYCYLAATVRWMLRGDVEEGDEGWVEDMDVDALVAYIRRGQTYDGGIAESSLHESHAGYAYCAIAALALLGRTSHSEDASFADTEPVRRGISDPAALVQFLASRQLAYLEGAADTHEDDDDDDDDDDDPENANFVQPPSLSSLTLDESIRHVGFNGRCNKLADTCYSWWVSGGLSMLGRADAVSAQAARAFLLDRTQHAIGGFSKYPGGPPDVYHGYLGMAALAVLGEPALKAFDAALCVSADTVRRIEKARGALLRAARKSGRAGGLTAKLLATGQSVMGGTPEWLEAI